MFHEKYLAQGSICGIDEFMRVKRGSGRFAVVESMGTVMRFGHIGLRRAMWEIRKTGSRERSAENFTKHC